MRVAAQTYSFATLLDKRQIDNAAIIRFCRELGLEAVELHGNYVRAEEMPAIQAALAETGLPVCSYGLTCDVVTADPAQRQARTKRFCADLERIASLAPEGVGVIPGPPRDGVPHALARQWLSEALRAAMPVAARLGFPLTIPNVGWQPVVYGTSEQILSICAAAGPDLKITYDVGNFLLAGEDNMQALRRLAPRVVHVHFKDWKAVPAPAPHAYPGADGRLYEGAVLGEGVMHLPDAVKRLREIGYRGWISVEYEGIGEPHEATRRGVAYVRSLLDALPAEA
ncbi:MAG TPA: sugar phosphate isomerase/epimerase family protein [Gemmataceae bacterium]|nr:sugar phosphate isomerase/epimerase family protein [Gemmataceae bacterium]